MTIHSRSNGDPHSGFALLPFMLATAAVLGVACFWLLTPRRGHSRILQTRTDTQTVSSAVMQYAIDNVTCPKSIKALNGGYLSNSTRVLDAWDEP